MIEFKRFHLEKGEVAKCIYASECHFTTPNGVEVRVEMKRELERFLAEFNQHIGVVETPYYRIDAFFGRGKLQVVEINAAFVDGWGTALNLARASGISVNCGLLSFPDRLYSHELAYVPELELLARELAILGAGNPIVCGEIDKTFPTYVYGRLEVATNIFPYDGVRVDNKMNLATFSRDWDGDLVVVPRHYFSPQDEWGKIPAEVFLKFSDKGSKECARGTRSVQRGKPSGKAKFLRKCYESGALIAQDIVETTRNEQEGKKRAQLVILAIGSNVITGYVQYSHDDIINDNSTHGPLEI